VSPCPGLSRHVKLVAHLMLVVTVERVYRVSCVILLPRGAAVVMLLPPGLPSGGSLDIASSLAFWTLVLRHLSGRLISPCRFAPVAVPCRHSPSLVSSALLVS
jgi:hypothetical protein